MNALYEAWQRYDVERELERVDVLEQREQLERQKARKAAEKRGVEASISKSAEESAEVVAAHAAVAALKAKGRARGRGAKRDDAAKGVLVKETRTDAEELTRLAEVMKRKHELIKGVMTARRDADALAKRSDVIAAKKEYERALACARELSGMIPELTEMQKHQAVVAVAAQPHEADASKVGRDHCQSHAREHSGCKCGGEKEEKPKTVAEEKLPMPDDLEAIGKMFLKDCYLGIGACALEIRQFASASEAFKEVLLLDDKHLAAWLQRGRAFEAMDAPLLAWLHYNQVTTTDVSFENAKECEDRIKRVLLGDEPIFQDDHSFEQPTSLLDALEHVQLVMDEGTVIMVEGFHEYAAHKYEHALRVLTAAKEEAVSAQASNVMEKLEVACHLNIASCYFEAQRQLPKALSHCQQALAIDPGHIVAQFRLGQINRAMYAYGAAMEAYQAVRTLLSYLPPSVASEHSKKLDEEFDKCEFERRQHDAAYIRQLMHKDTAS